MYSLPDSFTGDFLVGKKVVVLSFCKYHFDIFFSDNCWIHVESGFELYEKGDLIEKGTAFPLRNTVLVRLLEEVVVEVRRLEEEGLSLIFGDMELVIIGNIGPYEAYRVSDGTHEFLV